MAADAPMCVLALLFCSAGNPADRTHIVVAGEPGIVRYQVLNNRRHILTADSRGHVALWDVLTVWTHTVLEPHWCTRVWRSGAPVLSSV